MPPQNTFTFWRKVKRHSSSSRLVRWFLAVNVPIAFLIGAFIHWQNSVVGEPTPRDIVFRLLIAIFAFGLGGVVIWWRVFRPAIKAAEEEERHINKHAA